MFGTLVKKGTKYARNLCQWGTNMPGMSEIVLKSCGNDFWMNLVDSNFLCLQAYLVAFERDCKRKWSVLDLRLIIWL